jgi:hypothetical protein
VAIPDSVNVSLRGPKYLFNTIDPGGLTLHIDARKCKEEQQWLAVSSMGTIFVPNTIRVIHYNPARVLVRLKTL